jgi:hypothetical protein
MNMRAKFQVASVTFSENGAEVKLVPVVNGSEENQKFFKWTPYGEIKLGLVNKEQAEAMKPGKAFYIDFTPAE